MNDKNEYLYENFNNISQDENDINEENLQILEEGISDLIKEEPLYNDDEDKNSEMNDIEMNEEKKN